MFIELSEVLLHFLVTAGIVAFLIVEKLVRYVEDHSGGDNDWSLGHHHHHHKHTNKLRDDDVHENDQKLSDDEKDGRPSELASKEKELDRPIDKARKAKTNKKDSLRKVG